MATKTKWFFFWLISGSFLVGILAVCFVVSAVNWLGSETFCSTGCHTMNGVAYAWKQGSHARTPSGKTADCSDRSEERRVGKECRSRWSPYH